MAEHPAVQAAAEALAAHVEDVWEKPPDDEQREDLAATAALAVPAVLRWAAGELLATSTHDRLCRFSPIAACNCALGTHHRWLLDRAAEVERDTRGGDRG